MTTSHEADIHAYYRRLEARQLVTSTSLAEGQREWLWQICDTVELESNPGVGFLAISLFNQYMASQPATGDLKTVATTCLLLALKYESDRRISVGDLTRLTDKKLVEFQVLAVLDYNLGYITPHHYLQYYWQGLSHRSADYQASLYILQLCSVRNKMQRWLPSLLAASSIYITRMLIGKRKQTWSVALQVKTLYTRELLLNCIKAIIRLLITEAKAEKLGYISGKFSLGGHYRVATTILDFYRNYRGLAAKIEPEVRF